MYLLEHSCNYIHMVSGDHGSKIPELKLTFYNGDAYVNWN